MLALDEHLAHNCGRPTGPRHRSESAPLAALAGEALGQRFRSWRGHSGRRYIFSVYDFASCPPYEYAVLIVAQAAANGERHVISVIETGCFPDIALANAAAAATSNGALELHVHLLARSRAERASVVADLVHLCWS